MLQELEFHMPRVQTSSYHIYERDSAGDEALRLGSETEVLYLLTSTCSSVIVGPPKNPLHLWFRRVFGEPFPRDPYRYIHQLDWVPKTLLFLFSMKKSGCIVLSDLVLSLPSLVCSVVSVEFVVYSCGAIHSSILRILLSVPQIRGFCCKYYEKKKKNRAPEQ